MSDTRTDDRTGEHEPEGDAGAAASERTRVTQRTRVAPRTIPTSAILGALLVLTIATIGLLVGNGSDDPEPVASKPTASAPAPKPSASPAAESPAPTKPAPTTAEVPRAFVEVYNNAGVTGLADSTASKVEGEGWKVVGVDNWYGKIPETTVYYPKKLKGQAEKLAADLGIDRVRPAVEPMKFDRLTLILTAAV